MPDNLQSPRNGGFALCGYRVLALEGRDATAFAQSQCMNEVATLPGTHWQWNGWLTPKGRVIALFAVIKFADDALWLLLPDADPGELASQLQRFVFRSKVTFTARDDLLASGAFAMPGQASGSVFVGDAEHGVELDLGAGGGPRSLRIAPQGNEVSVDVGEAARWMAVDLEHGLPRLAPDQAGQWTPQMLSLQRLHAFSVKKGCYPGQEIIARTHFLGQSKRGLALLQGDEPVVPGSEVRDVERVLGNVVSVASSDGRHLALAVLQLEREGSALQVDCRRVREIPLLDGLAR